MADYDPARPFDVRSASLYRVAMDLAKEDRMLTSLAPGQSEHSNLPHYRDGLQPWFSGDPRLFPRSAFLVEEGTTFLLKLEPGG
jgi:acyl-homoserine lactone acylase PvdQ